MVHLKYSSKMCMPWGCSFVHKSKVKWMMWHDKFVHRAKSSMLSDCSFARQISHAAHAEDWYLKQIITLVSRTMAKRTVFRNTTNHSVTIYEGLLQWNFLYGLGFWNPSPAQWFITNTATPRFMRPLHETPVSIFFVGPEKSVMTLALNLVIFTVWPVEGNEELH